MSYDNHTNNPTGRIYRKRNTREHWTVELEIGGAVWMRSDTGQLTTLRAYRLGTAEFERVA
ncbi:hypothetical protein [Pseudomonas sp.]|uniref:hypothetical protein n=1 Tax=Pseudomonas sp. TaxID=306 RepID=UPI00258EACA5|nr:hypothetical protein [Pseudomonas sp.]